MRFRERKNNNLIQGSIGITLNSDWGIPYNEALQADKNASMRFMDFFLGWFANPVLKGDYPDSMKSYLIYNNTQLQFSASEKLLLNNSVDFLGINHYTSVYVQSGRNDTGQGWLYDKNTTETQVRNGIFIGPRAKSKWLYVYPEGMRYLLKLH